MPRAGTGKRAPHITARPLLLNTDRKPEARADGSEAPLSEAPQFYFDFSWRQLLPNSRIEELHAAAERLVRRDIWAKHGRSMHFLTLEFHDDRTEKDFVEDSTRRTKRWIEYAVLVMGVFNFVVAISRWVAAYAYGTYPATGAGDAATSAVLYLLQYLQIKFDRGFVLRNFQPLIFFWSLVHMTNGFVWICYISPDEYEALATRAGSHEVGGFLQESVLNDLVATLVACRPRFFYFMVYALYGFIGYAFFCEFKCGTRNVLVISAGLTFLSYTIEVLQRTDFIQSTQVWKESKRSQKVLSNILPEPIIQELKTVAGASSIARSYKTATILFADVVSFTTMSSQISPQALVELLNRMFRGIDDLAEDNGVEKIKTIGDCYMAASGLPVKRRDHAKAMARFGLQMLKLVGSGAFKNPASDQPIRVRVGIHSGPCVAGVIGHKKFAYDVWGDAVNTAARMESHGEPMHLHCSSETQALLGEDFICEARDPMQVKGKGEMQTYFVVAERNPTSRPSGGTGRSKSSVSSVATVREIGWNDLCCEAQRSLTLRKYLRKWLLFMTLR